MIDVIFISNRLRLVLAIAAFVPSMLIAQPEERARWQQIETAGSPDVDVGHFTAPAPTPVPMPHDIPPVYAPRSLFIPPFAGRDEPHLRASRELAEERLRLDIGASFDLVSFDLVTTGRKVVGNPLDDRDSDYVTSVLAFGVDAFTWIRLQEGESFTFPLETIDYSVGMNASFYEPRWLISDFRLRLGHASSHRVDIGNGLTIDTVVDAAFSREFIDLTIRGNGETIRHDLVNFSRFVFNPYIGARYLVHPIPDELGRFTPYGGIDITKKLAGFPYIYAFAGYELRLNSERESIAEHHLRIGLKLGEPNINGLTIDARYYRGRSPVGQYSAMIEEFTAIGFEVEF